MTSFEFLTHGDSPIFAYNPSGNRIMKTYFQDSLRTYTALHQMPDVLNAFGMVMPERSFSNEKYRYGFNGKENDNEVKGVGNSVDFGARIYDGRLGRFLSIDPLAQKFPSESNYSYAGNSPIFFIDNEGKKKTTYLVTLLENGKINIQVQVNHRAIALKSYRTHEGDVKFWSADIKQTIVKDHNGKVIHKSAETFTQSKDNYFTRRIKNAFSGEQTQAFGFDIKNTGGFESPAANDIKGKADVIEQLDLEGMAMPDGAGKNLTKAVDAFVDVANKIRDLKKMSKTGVDENLKVVADIISGSFEFGEKMVGATEFAVDKFNLDKKPVDTTCTGGCNEKYHGTFPGVVKNQKGDSVGTVPAVN